MTLENQEPAVVVGPPMVGRNYGEPRKTEVRRQNTKDITEGDLKYRS